MNSHLHVAITDEELSEWADKRADDAGRLARELIASRNGQKVPQDVTKLVIAARVVAFEDQSREAIRALDIASEAFADRVPWDGEPALSPPAVPGEVEFERLGNINRDVVEQLQAGYSWTTRIAVGEWSPQSVQLYIKSEPTASVPLPEIEGGDAPSDHVRVKPLDWHRTEQGNLMADAGLATYFVAVAKSDGKFHAKRNHPADEFFGPFEAEDECCDAAQADYERRILGAINAALAVSPRKPSEAEGREE